MGRLIKRCPFCGGVVEIRAGMLMDAYCMTYHVICTSGSCGADVWFYESEFSRDDTIDKWNRRDDHGEIHSDTEDH